MASHAKYTAAIGSDEEAPAVVPRQVRVANRVAAAALLVSAATFAAVATTAVRGGAPPPAGTAPIVPTAEAAGGAGVVGLISAAPAGSALSMPHAHRTKAPSAIYLERSTGGEKLGDLPTGTVLLPMKQAAGGWVQAVVPKQPGQSPTMGWVHAPQGFDALLSPEPRVLQTQRKPTVTMTKAQLSQKWEMVRAKNDENKVSLAALQSGVQRSFGKTAAGAGAQAVSEGAAKLHLRQEFDALRKEVKKELAGARPTGVIGDLAKVFH